jgi:hypothetical protein
VRPSGLYATSPLIPQYQTSDGAGRMAASGQLRTLHCLIGPAVGESSAAPYQQQGPGDPANNYDCQCCSGLNAPVPPWACLQYEMEPQQSRRRYQNARLKTVIDAFALWRTFFNRPACQIKSASSNKRRYCDRCRNAWQRNNFTEGDARHDECENNCGKRNRSGLPAKSDRVAHPRFSKA